MKRKIFKKRETFVDKQLKRVETRIEKADPWSDEYKDLLETRNSLLKSKASKKFKVDPEIVKTIAEVGIAVGTAVVNVKLTNKVLQEYRDIAALSYGLDDEMQLCNGRVNSMKDQVIKLLPKK